MLGIKWLFYNTIDNLQKILNKLQLIRLIYFLEIWMIAAEVQKIRFLESRHE